MKEADDFNENASNVFRQSLCNVSDDTVFLVDHNSRTLPTLPLLWFDEILLVTATWH